MPLLFLPCCLPAGTAIGALIVTDQILGRTNVWSDLYSPSRALSLLAPSSVQVQYWTKSVSRHLEQRGIELLV